MGQPYSRRPAGVTAGQWLSHSSPDQRLPLGPAAFGRHPRSDQRSPPQAGAGADDNPHMPRAHGATAASPAAAASAARRVPGAVAGRPADIMDLLAVVVVGAGPSTPVGTMVGEGVGVGVGLGVGVGVGVGVGLAADALAVGVVVVAGQRLAGVA